MRQTQEERGWLETLAESVEEALRDGSHASLVASADNHSLPTDPGIDGWYSKICGVRGANASFYLFLDNSLGEHRRTVWYGAGATTYKAVHRLDELGRLRWPRTQVHLSDVNYKFERLRYSDPVLERYDADEYYYGWYESELPSTAEPPSKALRGRISERLNALMSQLEEGDGISISLDQLDELDGLRDTKVRLEQGLLRKYLLGGRTSADCALCGETFPISLLVAAHIKPRAACSDSERKQYKTNLMAVCALGCDALFERGYLSVARGRVVSGPLKASGFAGDRVGAISGRVCSKRSPASASHFKWHRAKHLVSAKARFQNP